MSLPLNIDWQQILLHAFNLVLLFGGLYLLLYKPVKKFMDERTAKYKALDTEINEKLASANDANAEAQEKLKSAEIKIENDLAQARTDAENEAEKIIKEAKEAKKKIINDAEDAGLREKNRIINEARGEIAELAIKAAEKVIMEKTAKKENSDA